MIISAVIASFTAFALFSPASTSCFPIFKLLLSTAEINKEPLAKIDYVDVVDFDTITPVDEIKGTTLVAIAVYIGKTRLIDNFIA